MIFQHGQQWPRPHHTPTTNLVPSGPPAGSFLRDPAGVLRTVVGEAGDSLAAYGPRLALAVLFGAAVYLGLRHLWWTNRHRRFAINARLVTVLAPPEVDPNSAQAFWSNLVGLLRPAYLRLLSGQPHVAFEYAWTGHTAQIRIWVPGQVPPGLVERAVEAAWPAARTETSSPFAASLPANAVVVGGRLRLARPDWLPLRTDHPADPVRALTGAAAGLAPGQHALVQILARPVTGRRLSRAHRAASALRGGTGSGRPWAWMFELITPHPRRRSSRTSTYLEHPEHAAEVRAILDKAREPQWDTLIRYALAATPGLDDNDPAGSPPASTIRRRLRPALRGRAHAIASAYALYAGHNYLRRRRVWRAHTQLSRRWLRRGDLLSVSELAALAHLPWDSAVPGLARAGANTVPPSPAIHAPGPGAKQLGVADAGTRKAVAVAVADGRHHLHLLGATGSGKSTLMGHMILADAAAGRAAIVIDPKGDLIADLLPRLPERAASRVVLFDPDDRGLRPTLNVLHGPDLHLASDNLVGIFQRIYRDSWGPRTDDILRSACLTLCRDPNATLVDMPRLLSDAHYRAPFTARLRDPILREFWGWYDNLSPAARAHATGPVLNKLRALLLREFIRTTIGGAPSTVDLSALLDGGLMLVRVPKGTLGADTTAVFGSLMLAKVWEAISHRARHGEHARADAALYIDECHNFLNLPHGLADLLAEARAYRLSVVLAHQDLAQLGRELREAISTNARNKIYFTVSPEDAHTLAHHVTPNLSEHDLAHLGAFQAAARLIVDSTDTPAFTLTTRPLPPPIPGRATAIRAATRARHRRRNTPNAHSTLPEHDPRRASPLHPKPATRPHEERTE